jgi:nucleoside-diphosphate-sugar epimerase
VYSSRAFSDLIREELGNPWLLRIKAPIWLLRIITFCGEYIGRMTGQITALNNDKYHIMRQRNWRCDIQPARQELSYEPKVKLAEGVRRSIQWYKENHWL